MLTDDIKEAYKELRNGYRSRKELLIDIFETPEEKRVDFRSAMHKTKAEGMKEGGTLLEDLGGDIAWVLYHAKHPIKAHNYRKEIRK